MPYLRWWLDVPPDTVTTTEQNAGEADVILSPRRTRVPRRFYGPAFPTEHPPPSWRTVAQNRSWRVSAPPSCRP
jgi:hypothetical protein